jgi:chromosome segregation ATPase
MRAELSDILDAIRNGETVIVTQRGKPDTVLCGNINDDLLESVETVETIDPTIANIEHKTTVTYDGIKTPPSFAVGNRAKSLKQLQKLSKSAPAMPKELKALSKLIGHPFKGVPNNLDDLKQAQKAMPNYLDDLKQAQKAMPNYLDDLKQAQKAMPNYLDDLKQAQKAMPNYLDDLKQAQKAVPNYLDDLKQAQKAMPNYLEDLNHTQAEINKFISLQRLQLEQLRGQLENSGYLTHQRFQEALKLTQLKYANIIKALEDK